MITDQVLSWTKLLWDYNFLKEPLMKSDCIMVLGSYDTSMARHAAQLYHEGWAPYLLMSGGLSPFTAQFFDRPEAQVFAQVAIDEGVPQDKILMEPNSTNTGENLRFTEKLLQEKGLDFQSFIFVQKPQMLRRVKSSVEVEWPDKNGVTHSHDVEFEMADHQYVNQEMLIHELVGTTQRIKIYPKLGFQTEQAMPAEVDQAYQHLIEAGYTKNMVAEASPN